MTATGMAAITLAAGSAQAANLRGFYPLDGNGIDPTGFGPSLTEPGGTVSYVDGLDGQAASFDGSGRTWLRASINSSGHVNPTFSWGAWVKLNDPNAWNIFLSNDNGGWDRFTQVKNGKWAVSKSGVRTSPHSTSSEWTFLAQTFDGNTQTLYVDDKPVFSYQDGRNVSHSFIDIGRNANSAYPLNGLMDGVFFFDDVLTADEVATIREGGAKGCGVYDVAELSPQSSCDVESVPEPTAVLGLIAVGLLSSVASHGKQKPVLES